MINNLFTNIKRLCSVVTRLVGDVGTGQSLGVCKRWYCLRTVLPGWHFEPRAHDEAMHTLPKVNGGGRGSGGGFGGHTAVRVEQTLPAWPGAAIQGFLRENGVGKQFTRAGFSQGCWAAGGAEPSGQKTGFSFFLVS